MAGMTLRGLLVAALTLVASVAVLHVVGVGNPPATSPESETSLTQHPATLDRPPDARLARELPRRIIEPTENWLQDLAEPRSDDPLNESTDLRPGSDLGHRRSSDGHHRSSNPPGTAPLPPIGIYR